MIPTLEAARAECVWCGEEIDVVHCYCGEEDTGYPHDGHLFTPDGCACHQRELADIAAPGGLQGARR
jgi:hypothetical protein